MSPPRLFEYWSSETSEETFPKSSPLTMRSRAASIAFFFAALSAGVALSSTWIRMRLARTFSGMLKLSLFFR